MWPLMPQGNPPPAPTRRWEEHFEFLDQTIRRPISPSCWMFWGGLWPGGSASSACSGSGSGSGSVPTTKKEGRNWGNLILALDPLLLCDHLCELTDRVEEFKIRFHNLKSEEGVEEMLLPGERGSRMRRNILEVEGGVVEMGVWIMEKLREFPQSQFRPVYSKNQE